MDITVKNLQSKFPIPQKKIIQKVGVGAGHVPASNNRATSRVAPTELSIVFVGAQRMRSINKKYLGHDYVTEVITFNLDGVAEIIICPSVASQNAKMHGASLQNEILLYVIHGLLHLAGYDDHAPADLKRMRLKEKQLLGKLL